jgi:hypothetical protein
MKIKWQNIKEKWQNIKITVQKRRWLKIVLLLLMALFVLSVVALCSPRVQEPAPLPPQELPPAPEPEPEPEPEPLPEPLLNPLTHLPLADEAALEKRVILVSIDNYKPARPQAGICTADVMYEVPAEGGISRLMGLFFTDTPEIIGPVRSARPYMVDVAREWRGLFVHCGGSPDALSYLAKGTVNWINEMGNGKYFWRDKSRHMPHNLFTSSENLYSFLEAKGWEQAQVPRAFSFYAKEEGPPASAALADIVNIDYSTNKNSYVYDQLSGLYARSISGEPHIDINTQSQVQAANILVQRVRSKVLDNVGRLEINLVGEGEALLFTSGTVQEGAWKRASLDEQTYFCGADGQEWRLSPGQTWIQLCDGITKVSYENSGEQLTTNDEV